MSVLALANELETVIDKIAKLKAEKVAIQARLSNIDADLPALRDKRQAVKQELLAAIQGQNSD